MMATLSACALLISLAFGIELRRTMSHKACYAFLSIMAISALGSGLTIGCGVVGRVPSPGVTATGGPVQWFLISGLVNLGLISAFLLAAPVVGSLRDRSWALIASPRGAFSLMGCAVGVASSVLGIFIFCHGRI